MSCTGCTGEHNTVVTALLTAGAICSARKASARKQHLYNDCLQALQMTSAAALRHCARSDSQRGLNYCHTCWSFGPGCWSIMHWSLLLPCSPLLEPLMAGAATVLLSESHLQHHGYVHVPLWAYFAGADRPMPPQHPIPWRAQAAQTGRPCSR